MNRDGLEEWLNEHIGDAIAASKEGYTQFLLGDDDKAQEYLRSAAEKAIECADAIRRFKYGMEPGGLNGKSSTMA